MTTRFPFAVHLTAASMTWGGEIVASSLIRALHKISGFTRLSFVIPRCARSTRRLGLGGLVPATTKKVQVGGFWGVEGACLPGPAESFVLEGVVVLPFFRASTALASCKRESWIFWSCHGQVTVSFSRLCSGVSGVVPK